MVPQIGTQAKKYHRKFKMRGGDKLQGEETRRKLYAKCYSKRYILEFLFKWLGTCLASLRLFF